MVKRAPLRDMRFWFTYERKRGLFAIGAIPVNREINRIQKGKCNEAKALRGTWLMPMLITPPNEGLNDQPLSKDVTS